MSRGRMPELDALRGLAAGVVLLFHLHPMRFFFGWAGVELFFVLSGYLITAIILREMGTRGFLKRFYMRRSLRIWPIYYLTVLGFAAANPWLPKPEPMEELPYLLTYTKNVPLHWRNTVPPPIRPLDHTWTLALEEQFYVIWPALVLLVGPGPRLMRLCAATIAVAVLNRQGGYFNWGDRMSERALLGRCDGFALGGLLAALLSDPEWVHRHVRALRGAFAAAALGALGYLVHGYYFRGGLGFIGLPTPSDPGWTILAFGVLSFGVIGLCAIDSGHPALAPLRFLPLVLLGQISYGVYLYHVPTFWVLDGFAFRYDRGFWADVLKLGVTVAVAAASWVLIERPILSLKDRFRYGREPAVLNPGAADPGASPAATREE